MRAFYLALALVAALVVGKSPTASAQGGPVASFDGFYVGGHVAGAFSDSSWTNLPGGANTFGATGTSRRLSPDGAFGGGQAGYMFQFENFVIGAEVSGSAGEVQSAEPGVLAGDTFNTRIEHMMLAQGKLGWAFGDWMVFAQGGYAGAKGQAFGLSGGTPSANGTAWHNGWTVGGGVQYKLGPLFTLGLEYNYVDLGRKTYNVDIFVVGDRASIDHEVHVIKATASLNLNAFFAQGVP